MGSHSNNCPPAAERSSPSPFSSCHFHTRQALEASCGLSYLIQTPQLGIQTCPPIRKSNNPGLLWPLVAPLKVFEIPIDPPHCISISLFTEDSDNSNSHLSSDLLGIRVSSKHAVCMLSARNVPLALLPPACP